jgi:hypothetical protein
MDLIIGRFLPPLNSSKTVGRVRRRDDNSRGKVRKVRADSSAEHRKWLREQERQLYSEALRSLARATVIPIGPSVAALESWFRELALVREALVTLQVYCTLQQDDLSAAAQKLFSVLDANDFAIIATDAANHGG